MWRQFFPYIFLGTAPKTAIFQDGRQKSLWAQWTVGWIAVIFDRMILYVFRMIWLTCCYGSIKNKMPAVAVEYKIDMTGAQLTISDAMYYILFFRISHKFWTVRCTELCHPGVRYSQLEIPSLSISIISTEIRLYWSGHSIFFLYSCIFFFYICPMCLGGVLTTASVFFHGLTWKYLTGMFLMFFVPRTIISSLNSCGHIQGRIQDLKKEGAQVAQRRVFRHI